LVIAIADIAADAATAARLLAAAADRISVMSSVCSCIWRAKASASR
jgi:hypothetical protein